jgi:hypothetical protein
MILLVEGRVLALTGLSKNSDDSDIVSNMNLPRYIGPCLEIILLPILYRQQNDFQTKPLSMSCIITFRYTYSE